MIVTCEKCLTKYNLSDDLVKDSGTKVKCSRCSHLFTAYKEPQLPDDAAEPASIQDVAGHTDDSAQQVHFDEKSQQPETGDPEMPAEESNAEMSAEWEFAVGEDELLNDEPEAKDLMDEPDLTDEPEESAFQLELDGEPERSGTTPIDEPVDERVLETIPGTAEAQAAETDGDLLNDELSLEELGLGEEEPREAQHARKVSLPDDAIPEDEITLADLGLDEESEESLPGATRATLGEHSESDEESPLDDLAREGDALPNQTAGRTAGEGLHTGEISTEEISFEDLGIEQTPSQDALSVNDTPQEQPQAEELSLEDLDIEQAPPQDTLSVNDTPQEQPQAEELSLEDLGLEEEVPPIQKADQDPDQTAGEEFGPEEISLEDLGLDEETAVVREGFAAGEEASRGAEATGEGESALEEFEFEESPVECGTKEGPAEAREFTGELELSVSEAVAVASVENPDWGQEETSEDMPLPPPVLPQPQPRRRISTPLMVFLAVVLLGGGAYGAYTLLNAFGVKVPSLESIAGPLLPEPTDAGNTHITLLDELISSEFVDTAAAGRLFVIKGKIRNDYPEARSFVRIKGVLYQKDGRAVGDRTIYCGIVLSDKELHDLEAKRITQKLSTRPGDGKSNASIAAGKVVPFMVVFPNLPQDLGEFSVEVIDSVAG